MTQKLKKGKFSSANAKSVLFMHGSSPQIIIELHLDILRPLSNTAQVLSV